MPRPRPLKPAAPPAPVAPAPELIDDDGLEKLIDDDGLEELVERILAGVLRKLGTMIRTCVNKKHREQQLRAYALRRARHLKAPAEHEVRLVEIAIARALPDA